MSWSESTVWWRVKQCWLQTNKPRKSLILPQIYVSYLTGGVIAHHQWQEAEKCVKYKQYKFYTWLILKKMDFVKFQSLKKLKMCVFLKKKETPAFSLKWLCCENKHVKRKQRQCENIMVHGALKSSCRDEGQREETRIRSNMYLMRELVQGRKWPTFLLRCYRSSASTDRQSNCLRRKYLDLCLCPDRPNKA